MEPLYGVHWSWIEKLVRGIWVRDKKKTCFCYIGTDHLAERPS